MFKRLKQALYLVKPGFLGIKIHFARKNFSGFETKIRFTGKNFLSFRTKTHFAGKNF